MTPIKYQPQDTLIGCVRDISDHLEICKYLRDNVPLQKIMFQIRILYSEVGIRIRYSEVRIRICKSEVRIRTSDQRIRTWIHLSNNSKKWLLYDFLSFKNDPLVRGKDPRIQNRIKSHGSGKLALTSVFTSNYTWAAGGCLQDRMVCEWTGQGSSLQTFRPPCKQIIFIFKKYKTISMVQAN